MFYIKLQLTKPFYIQNSSPVQSPSQLSSVRKNTKHHNHKEEDHDNEVFYHTIGASSVKIISQRWKRGPPARSRHDCKCCSRRMKNRKNTIICNAKGEGIKAHRKVNQWESLEGPSSRRGSRGYEKFVEILRISFPDLTNSPTRART